MVSGSPLCRLAVLYNMNTITSSVETFRLPAVVPLPMAPIVTTRALTRRFGSTLAVDELTLEIQQGEVFGFLGHNGAGKTTTVRLLNGVLSPTSGEIRVFGLDPSTDGAAIRGRVGVLTETPALDDRLTARKYLRYFAEIYGVPRNRVDDRVDEMLALFDLSERADTKLGGFSKGMRQRMALARTVLHEPEIVYLDEPTSGLDPVATREVHQMIQKFRAEKRTVFLATHNLHEAERLCDRVAVLAHGRVLAMGSMADLASHIEHGNRINIEVDGDRVPATIAALEYMPGVTTIDAQPDRNGDGSGGAIVCVHGVGRTAVPQLIAQLLAANIALYRVEPDEASLEDVYFALSHE